MERTLPGDWGRSAVKHCIFQFLQKIGEHSAIARRRLFRAAVGFREKETDRDRQRERETEIILSLLPTADRGSKQAPPGYGGAPADFFWTISCLKNVI